MHMHEIKTLRDRDHLVTQNQREAESEWQASAGHWNWKQILHPFNSDRDFHEEDPVVFEEEKIFFKLKKQVNKVLIFS